MSLPFLNLKPKKREHIVVIDLGGSTTKAIYVRHQEGRFTLMRFVVQESPAQDKGTERERWAERMRQAVQALAAPTRQIILVVDISDSVVRHAEMPLVPVSDMRMMLKLNTKNYLQQDLPDYDFDCYIPPSALASASGEGSKGLQKYKVIVGGARKSLLEDLQAAARSAGLVVDQIAPNLIGPVNALEMAEPAAFQKDVLALIDLGFKHSSISLIASGELSLNRVVALGGDLLTAGLAEVMNISYAEAEGIKVGMPQEVESALQGLILPLGRELRTSIDFFEHQQDKTVSQVFVCGGAAASDFLIMTLQSELMVPCKKWNPVGFMEMGLPPEQSAEIEKVAPRLAVAVGAAVAAAL